MSPVDPISPPDAAPGLTDRALLLRRRVRAQNAGHADFLHRIAIAEIQDRLADINRSFTDIAIVTGFPDLWADAFPAARILPDDPVLNLSEAGFDLVIHAMALHMANDPVGQIIQSARALRPDGLFLGLCLGGETLQELRDVMQRAEIAATGGLSPRIMPMGELRDLGALLSRAGLALPVADHLPQLASYRDLFHLARDLRAMGEGNVMQARLRQPTKRAVFAQAAALYAADYPDFDDPDRIRASFDLIFLTGWAPAPHQQKPLRPGSAKMPLADALKMKKD